MPNYNSKDNMWYFSLQYHDSLVKQLKKIGASVGRVPTSVASLFGAKMFLPHAKPESQFIIKNESEELNEVPENLSNKLFPFQKEGIEFAVKQGGRCLIGFVYYYNHNI